jgi:hypothetical protein
MDGFRASRAHNKYHIHLAAREPTSEIGLTAVSVRSHSSGPDPGKPEGHIRPGRRSALIDAQSPSSSSHSPSPPLLTGTSNEIDPQAIFSVINSTMLLFLSKTRCGLLSTSSFASPVHRGHTPDLLSAYLLAPARTTYRSFLHNPPSASNSPTPVVEMNLVPELYTSQSPLL